MPAPPGTAPSPPEGSAPEAPAPQLEGDSLEHAGSWPRVTGNTRLTKREGQRPIRGKDTVPLEGRQQQETGLGAEGSSPEVGGRPGTDACLQNLGWCCHALRGSYLATLLPKRFITKTLIMLALRGGAFSSSPTPDGALLVLPTGAGLPEHLPSAFAPLRCGGGVWRASRADGDRVPGGRGLRARPAASTQAPGDSALHRGPLRDSAGPAGGRHGWTVLSREQHTGNFRPEWLPGGSLGGGPVGAGPPPARGFPGLG